MSGKSVQFWIVPEAKLVIVQISQHYDCPQYSKRIIDFSIWITQMMAASHYLCAASSTVLIRWPWYKSVSAFGMADIIGRLARGSNRQVNGWLRRVCSGYCVRL